MMSEEQLLNLIGNTGRNRGNLRRLLEQLHTPLGVIPFVGAGLSIPCGFPGWQAFLLKEARKGGVETTIAALIAGGEFEEAAEVVSNALGPRDFEDAMDDAFGDHKLKDKQLTSAITMLPTLASGPVITTNFDHVLEKAFDARGCRFDQVVIGARPDLVAKALQQNRRFLLKIHGDVEDRTDRILTRAQYEEHYGNTDPTRVDLQRPLPTLLGRMLSSRPLLFLGCSLAKDRTVAVIRHIAENLPGGAHYAIVEHPGSDEELHERAHHLSALDIGPIWYPHGRHDLVEHILTYLTERMPPQFRGCRQSRGGSGFLSGPNDPRLTHRSGFYGRSLEIEVIVRFLNEGTGIATVTASAEIYNLQGAPGIGKTEVCKEALRCHLVAHPDQPVLFVEISGADNETGFIVRLAESLGIADVESREQVVDAVKSMTGTVYLDNLEDVVRDPRAIHLLQQIAAIPGVRVLASSREPLPGIARDFTVPRLDIDASAELFFNQWEPGGAATAQVDLEELREFLDRDLDRHPLSIFLVAAQRYRCGSVARLRDRWRRESIRLATLPIGPQDRLTSLGVSISLSYQAVHNDMPVAVALWGAIAMFPEGLSEAAWEVLFGPQGEKVVASRDTLLRLNIAELDGRGTLHMLAPIREFIVDKARRQEDGLSIDALAEAAYPFFIFLARNVYERRREENYATALDNLLAEFPNLHYFVHLTASIGGNWPRKLSELSFFILNFYQLRVLHGVDMLQCLLPRQLSAGLSLAAAQSLHRLGDLARRLGQIDEAMAHYQEASNLFRQERSNLGLANTFQSMGDLKRGGREFTEAESLYAKARDLYISERDSMGLAYTCSELARVWEELGDHGLRERYLAEAIDSAKRSNVSAVVAYVQTVKSELGGIT